MYKIWFNISAYYIYIYIFMILKLYLRYLNITSYNNNKICIYDFIKIIENNTKTYLYVQNMIPYFCILLYTFLILKLYLQYFNITSHNNNKTSIFDFVKIILKNIIPAFTFVHINLIKYWANCNYNRYCRVSYTAYEKIWNI